MWKRNSVIWNLNSAAFDCEGFALHGFDDEIYFSLFLESENGPTSWLASWWLRHFHLLDTRWVAFQEQLIEHKWEIKVWNLVDWGWGLSGEPDFDRFEIGCYCGQKGLNRLWSCTERKVLQCHLRGECPVTSIISDQPRRRPIKCPHGLTSELSRYYGTTEFWKMPKLKRN